MDERLAQTFVELADTLVGGFDLMEFLHMLTERCVELLEVSAAGLLLADSHGTLQLVAASTERARVVELFQVQNDEGPCLDSYRSGRPVIVPDMTASHAGAQWPMFTTAARELGFAAVHAIPMRLRDQVIGTLNLFGAVPDGLDPAVARAAKALVDVATIGILQERATREQELVAGLLQVTLNSRVIIEQAKGVLAERMQVSPDQAFIVLRAYSRSNNCPLTQLAADVIGGTAELLAGRRARPQPPPGRKRAEDWALSCARVWDTPSQAEPTVTCANPAERGCEPAWRRGRPEADPRGQPPCAGSHLGCANAGENATVAEALSDAEKQTALREFLAPLSAYLAGRSKEMTRLRGRGFWLASVTRPLGRHRGCAWIRADQYHDLISAGLTPIGSLSRDICRQVQAYDPLRQFVLALEQRDGSIRSAVVLGRPVRQRLTYRRRSRSASETHRAVTG
jgi:hypothetical protein